MGKLLEVCFAVGAIVIGLAVLAYVAVAVVAFSALFIPWGHDRWQLCHNYPSGGVCVDWPNGH